MDIRIQFDPNRNRYYIQYRRWMLWKTVKQEVVEYLGWKRTSYLDTRTFDSVDDAIAFAEKMKSNRYI